MKTNKDLKLKPMAKGSLPTGKLVIPKPARLFKSRAAGEVKV